VVYTEVRKTGKNRKFYRVYTYRKDGKVVHLRKYLGSDLPSAVLRKKEQAADLHLTSPLNALLTPHDRDVLEHVLRRHNEKHPSMFENRYEAFISEFTYDSTGIEGNTLTLRETAAVLFEGATPAKSLREVYEVLNHKKAFDYVLAHKGDITTEFLGAVQAIVTANTLKPEVADQLGRYRTVPVFIRGAKIVPPPAARVPKEMRRLLSWYSKNRNKTHPVVLAAYFHSAFEAIHPFVDGNGRVGRIALNFILHKSGYPMISIPRTQRVRYFEALAKAQAGNLRPFVQFLIRLLKNTDKSI